MNCCNSEILDTFMTCAILDQLINSKAVLGNEGVRHSNLGLSLSVISVSFTQAFVVAAPPEWIVLPV